MLGNVFMFDVSVRRKNMINVCIKKLLKHNLFVSAIRVLYKCKINLTSGSWSRFLGTVRFDRGFHFASPGLRWD